MAGRTSRKRAKKMHLVLANAHVMLKILAHRPENYNRTDLSVSDRARKVQVDLDRKHVNLDNQNPGSTFVKTQKDFNNGKYLALVLGPFGQFSLHASDFVELIAQSRALLMMRHRKIKAEHAYGLCRAPVVSRIGLAGSLGWVRLILDRFRDAACPHPDSSSPFIDLGVDEFNFESFGSQPAPK